MAVGAAADAKQWAMALALTETMQAGMLQQLTVAARYSRHLGTNKLHQS